MKRRSHKYFSGKGQSTSRGAVGKDDGRKTTKILSEESKKLEPKASDPSIPTIISPTQVSEKTMQTPSSKQTPTQSKDIQSYPSSSTMSETEAMARLGLEIKPSPELGISWPFPKRPEIGNTGRKISLLANRFMIDIPEGCVYHYDIVIFNEYPRETSEKDRKVCSNKKENREVMEFVLKSALENESDIFHKMRPAYDGKNNLFTRRKLLTIDGAKEINISYKSKDYIICIKPVKKDDDTFCGISFEPLRELYRGALPRYNSVRGEEILLGVTALETILRHGAPPNSIPVYRSFFPPQKPVIPPLRGGREIWLGYHQSLQLSQLKPTINVDMSATVFYESGPVLHYLMYVLFPTVAVTKIPETLRKVRSLTESQINSLFREIGKLQIEVIHLPYTRRYRIHEITSQAACDIYFEEVVNGNKIRKSVSQYFATKYPKHTLKYPNLPCINGKKDGNTFIPLELCNIVGGQHCKKDLTEGQKREVVKTSSLLPKERFGRIKKRIETTKENLEQCVEGLPSFAEEFGIHINTAPMKLEGRILKPPHLSYFPNQQLLPSDGVWNMYDKTFFEVCDSINRWILISFSNLRDEETLRNFGNRLCKQGSKVGVNFIKPLLVKCYDINTSPSSELQRVLQTYKDLQLAVIVVPPKQKDRNIYREIKMSCETKFGLMTQCVVEDNAKKCSTSVIFNLCLKINAKMGGINNSLETGDKPDFFKKPVIIIGADCNHPSPGDAVEPSIAAVVGSLDSADFQDSGPAKYRAAVRLQIASPKEDKQKTKRKEIIVELKDMVKELLSAFLQLNKNKLEHVIFYRDGVSEGEFKQVLEEEVTQVKCACQEISSEYKPQITYIVVGKRHHTRFMPEFETDSKDDKGNIPPGTTVDTEVTHPLYWDYFLCSHVGIQGTSRPAHYTVLCNDNKFSADELEKLTYYLCYTYSRCTRSISIPCPVMYAHLAAYRAKQRLYHVTRSSKQSNEPMSEKQLLLEMKQAVNVVESMKNKMYFV